MCVYVEWQNGIVAEEYALRSLSFSFYFPSCTDYNVLLKVCRAKVIECVQNQSLTDRNVRVYNDICEKIHTSTVYTC